MSKNILYQTKKTVNGQEKSVVANAKNTNYLRTNLQSGGTCDWVPEDEVQKVIPKIITQDGTYEASKEPGSPYGYSEVTVQGIGDKVMGDLGTITITKNGTYYAKNTYDGVGPFYGYKTVIVNVTRDSDSGTSSNASSNSKTGKNSSGEDVNYSVDSNGNLVVKKVASTINVTTKPKFLTYRNGETINYAGIVVKAYAGSSVYSGDDYPGGIIPTGELVFPVKNASGSGGQSVSIPVRWRRPEDGKTLETTFSIKVNNA